MHDLGELEARVHAFEQEWSSDSPPRIEHFVGPVPDEESKRALLLELVCVDLEYRWKRGIPRSLPDYLTQFPMLALRGQIPLELIAEEYRARLLWGDRPTLEKFLREFGSLQVELRPLLSRSDDEIRAEENSSSLHAAPSQPTEELVAAPMLHYDDYVLQQMIGAGRMGRVYRAWHRELEISVAVKYLRKSFLKHYDAVERFVREARTVSLLRHPGIVKIHGLGRTPGGGYFIAMDLVTGGDLFGRLGGTNGSVSQAVEWTIQACDALQHSHECGIIHCDLKPANLLIDETSNLLVTDFGLARSLSEEEHAVDRIEGTAGYIAPEQVSRWWGPMTNRTDVYGLGAVLYALLTKKPPHDGATLTDILAHVVSGVAVVPPKTFRPELPQAIEDVCLRCLAKTPTDRFGDMNEMRQALEDACNLS